MKCPNCGMLWEKDNDQFGCWNCGYSWNKQMNFKTVSDLLALGNPVYISADNKDIRIIKPKNGKCFHYTEIYGLLDIEMAETVSLYDGNIMILDEEGKLKDDAQVNDLATRFFQINRMSEEEMRKMGEDIEKKGFAFIATMDSDLGFPENSIVGNVIITPPKYLE